jgi:hypothetical protein
VIMAGNLSRVRVACALALVVTSCAWSCDRPGVVSAGLGGRARLYTGTDSMGAVPAEQSAVPIRTRLLPENSAAAMSRTQSGVLFTINDSGNEPVLYAIDTTGTPRGAWRIVGARNVDWESAAAGPCKPGGAPTCIYIGDTGDNDGTMPERSIYRVVEPDARPNARPGEIRGTRLDFTYVDGPHDVEAIYVAPTGDIFLISKRPMTDAAGRLRPALVYRIAAGAWSSSARAVAERVDSLEIVPGSAPLRVVTDAALSADGKHLAVRTYMQVYVFAADPATGRVDHRVAPAVCNIVSLGEQQGEGITWADDRGRLVLTSEGPGAPLELATCPLPR